jgi:hypothetical protein
MSPSASPGRLSLHIPSSFATSVGLHRELPTARPSRRYRISGLTSSPLLQPAELLASLTETFTSGLAAVWSPSPPPDITTVPTGQSAPAELSSAGTAASVAARALLGSWEIPLEACPELGTPAIPVRPCSVGRPDAAFRQTNGVGIATIDSFRS